MAKSAGAIKYIDCFTAEDKSRPTCVLDMTLNYLIVSFQ